MSASIWGWNEILSLLIERGAHLRVQTEDDQMALTALNLAIDNHREVNTSQLKKTMMERGELSDD